MARASNVVCPSADGNSRRPSLAIRQRCQLMTPRESMGRHWIVAHLQKKVGALWPWQLASQAACRLAGHLMLRVIAASHSPEDSPITRAFACFSSLSQCHAERRPAIDSGLADTVDSTPVFGISRTARSRGRHTYKNKSWTAAPNIARKLTAWAMPRCRFARLSVQLTP